MKSSENFEEMQEKIENHKGNKTNMALDMALVTITKIQRC